MAPLCALPREGRATATKVLSLISRASAGHCTFTEIFTALSVWLHPCLALDQSLASLKLCHSIVYYTEITTYCQELFFTYLKNFLLAGEHGFEPQSLVLETNVLAFTLLTFIFPYYIVTPCHYTKEED